MSKGTFDDLDKSVNIVPEKKMRRRPEVTEVEFKPDWKKISKAVLLILKPNMTSMQYNLLEMASEALLKKRSKFSMFVTSSVLVSVQVAGVYKLVSLIINLF